MASSSFRECKSRCGIIPQENEDQAENDAGEEFCSNDLVVVLKNDKIHVDSGSLGRFIEEKTINSLSVIRIASPTPSMLEEEQKKREENAGSEEDSGESGSEELDENDATDGTDNEAADSDDAENNDGTSEANKRRKKKTTQDGATDNKKLVTKKKNKKKLEVVGVTVEHFFDFLEAKKILDMAIDPNQKFLSTLENLVEVIRNDHCYTPWTSPSHKLRMNYSTVKSNQRLKLTSDIKKKDELKTSKDKDSQHDDDSLVDDELNSSSYAEEEGEFEETEYSSSNFQSSESDNDRDSDLDFRVNSGNSNKSNRGRRAIMRRKRKLLGALKDGRRLMAVKSKHQQMKRQPNAVTSTPIQHIQAEVTATSNVVPPTTTSPPTAITTSNTTSETPLAVKSSSLRTIRRQLNESVGEIISLGRPFKTQQQQHQPLTMPMLPSLSKHAPPVATTSANSVITTTTPTTHIARPIIMGRPARRLITIQPSIAPAAPAERDPEKRKVIITEVLTKPAKAQSFTDVTKLLTQAKPLAPIVHPVVTTAPPTIPVIIAKPITTPTTTTMPSISKSTLKEFLSTLEGETKPQAAVVQHMSSELAVENETKLELIADILNDEMQRAQTDQPSPPTARDESAGNENIPKLVKMLESTVVESSSSSLVESSDNKNLPPPVADNDYMDIDNNESLPEDLLLNVDDLLSNEEELQMVMDKIDVEDNDNPCPPTLPPKVFEEKLEKVQPAPVVAVTTSSVTQTTTLTPTSVSSPREPIKIIRGNGRVITLPPIEAPTTRSRLRAQASTTPTLSKKLNTSVSSQLSSSLVESAALSDTSSDVISAVQVSSAAVSVSSSAEDVDDVKNAFLTPNKTNSRKRGSAKKSTGKKKKAAKNDDDDDPNKLWCKCRQPHNNRFMICCDSCEEWFHGDCVSVLKREGEIMERQGLEWHCEDCKKKSPKVADVGNITPNVLKSSSKKTAESETNHSFVMPVKTVAPSNNKNKPVTTPTTTNNNSSATKSPSTTAAATTPTPTTIKPTNSDNGKELCIVCKKILARSNTNYCSDDCIKKHAQHAMLILEMQSPATATSSLLPPTDCPNTSAAALVDDKSNIGKKKTKSLFEDCLTLADATCKIERVCVYDRRTGRTLSGSLAPVKAHLRKWLQDNPTYEVFLPGINKPKETEAQKPKVPVERKRIIKYFSMPGSNPPKPKQVPPVESKQEHAVHETPTQRPKPPKDETIRQKVRRTIGEEITKRMQDEERNYTVTKSSEDMLPTLTSEEISDFAKKLEAEMFRTFQTETNPKYLVKYRSFMFNIKQMTNKTLISNICRKLVTPEEIVTMSPADLASQELRKWREEENKHNLQVITMHELDTRIYISNREYPTHNDIVIDPVNEVVSLNKYQDIKDTTKNDAETKKREPRPLDMETRKLEEKPKEKESDKEKEVEKPKDRSHHHHHHSDRERHGHHKNKESRHQKGKKRSRSRSREKRHKGQKKRKESDDKRRDKAKEKESNKEKEKLKDQSNKSKDPKKFEKMKMENNIQAFNLIDQILTSSKTVEEAANLVPEKKKFVPPQPQSSTSELISSPTVTSISSPTHSTTHVANQSQVTNDVRDDIPTSSRKSPEDPFAAYIDRTIAPLWHGLVSMIDVTEIDLIIQPLAGNSHRFGTFLPDCMDIVGRINPDSVWDYLTKVKNNVNKEIVLLYFLPAKPSENLRYNELCEYLEQRNRLGVLKAASPQIKDFYMMPLLSRTNFPPVLRDMQPVELFNDIYKPNLLIGIAVRVTGQGRRQNSMVNPADLSMISMTRHETPSTSLKRKRHVEAESYQEEDDVDVDAIIKAPIGNQLSASKPKPANHAALVGLYDADEPYSPGGSTDEDMPLLPTRATAAAASGSSSVDKTMDIELKRKMDELNRQIAAQEKEIAGLLDKGASNVLANISIPSNLSQILASIQHKPEASSAAISGSMPRPSLANNMNDNAADEEYNPEDDITYAYSSSKTAATNAPATSSGSLLSTLSEAELLSMVPDDMIEPLNTSSGNKKIIYPLPFNEEPPPPGV